MSGKKIVFITPPYERIARGYEYVKHVTNRTPTLGLLHLAAEVREHGWVPSIIESDVFDLSVDEVVEQVVETDPAYVGITLFTVGVWCGAEIARKIKARLPHVTILVGGPHISSMGPETMQRFPEFDYAVVGEGEEILTELLEALETGGDLNAVDGIIYTRPSQRPGDPGRNCIVTAKRAVTRDMDRLPMPAWDLLPGFPEDYRPAVFDFPRQPVASIAASRGCPFHCRFCDTSTFGAAVRAYSAERVFEIMQHLQNEYGVKHILFVDDLFTASRKRTTELCHLIIESGMDITWSCASRVDVVKKDLLDLMKRAGCWEISFGLETGSDAMLKKMDKSAAVARSEETLQWCADAGIRSKGLFMLGYPGETRETIAETKAFLERVPLSIMHLTKFTPYPGSPIYHDLYGTKVRDDHWEKMNGMNFLWTTEGFTAEELDAEYNDLIRSFYRRRQIGRYYLGLALQHPGHLTRSITFLAAMLKSKLKARFGFDTQPETVHLDQGATPSAPRS